MDVKYYLAGFFSALILVTTSILGFYLGKSESKNNFYVTTPTPRETNTLKDPGINEDLLIEGNHSLSIRDRLIKAITTKKYSDIENQLTDPVIVRMEETGCCPPMKPKEAIIQLSYLDNALDPWNFDEEYEIILNLKSTYPEDFGNATIGVSANGYLVAFNLTKENRVSKITMAKHYSQILP